MRLHSSTLTYTQIHDALDRAKAAGKVARHVHFHILTEHGSRSRARAWEIQLGTYNKVKGDKRGWKNTGTHGADSIYAATYDEWGYFIAELFQYDPHAIFGTYNGLHGFNQATNNKYSLTKAGN